MGANGREKLDLVGTFEASIILGVERSRIARFLEENRKGNHRIPEPVAVLKCGPIWTRAQIEGKLAEMYAEFEPKDGEEKKPFDEWAAERSLGRVRELKNPLEADEVGRILGPRATLVAA